LGNAAPLLKFNRFSGGWVLASQVIESLAFFVRN
jgi:hypothetical protein